MRGRRPDAASQEAKGNPGKRRKKPTVSDRIKMLADAPSPDAFSPPVMFGLEEFEGVIRIWREFVPELSRRNLIDAKLDRYTLAMFCYYLDQWQVAVATIAQQGSTQRVKTTSGGYRIHDHPSIEHRDKAVRIVMDLSTRFGFTPFDRHKLIREMAGTGVPIGGLFDEREAPEAPAPEEASSGDDIIGFAGRSMPPGQRPN